ncbi:MAG: hypothetical protein V5788_08545 [Shewanella sp.]
MSLCKVKKRIMRQYLFIPSKLVLIILAFHFPCQANDKTILTNADAPPLDIGIALDSEGKPISIPTVQSALEYHTPPAYQTNKNISKHTPRPKKKSATILSKKQRLISRVNVANDPSCRWLDSRINKLEKNLSHAGNQNSYGFHRNELKIRHKEWQCMQCGAEGPNQTQRDICQHRR